jgi:hypothetical protein
MAVSRSCATKRAVLEPARINRIAPITATMNIHTSMVGPITSLSP